ncbi:restriction endonuclease subunit S [Acinetobacter baumannii]|uniref:restriction endonuclease subunit S n=1 Tax=Acinetobacter baumannii TaxID=470 RepID=UPI000E5AE89D|nr:restriction endonuclease subunit S [Acinetobacter baumannii]
MAKYQAYVEYKDSGVEWLGKIPSHWLATQVKYGYLVTLGKMLQSTPKSSLDELKLYLKAQNIQPNGINIDQVESMWFSPDECKKLLLQKSDVLVSEGGDAGRSAIWNCELEECYIQNAINRVRPKYVNNSKYFLYWMKFLKSTDFINIICNKATIAHYTAEKLEGSPIFLPSSDEQIAIANFLDHETAKIDHLIEKQQQLIELLKEKRQAVISHAVTKGLDPNVPMKDSGVEWLGEVPEHWNMAPVRRYLVEHRQGYYTTESYVDEGLKLLRITDLRDLGEINISNCPMVNESDTTHLFKLQKGDVVFARTGGAGSFGVITEDYENLIYASYLIRFRFMNKIFEPDYLRFLFQSDSFQLSVKQNIHGGVNQNIHAEDIKNTVICAPSLSEQKEIIEYLENQCLLFENLIYKASYSVKLMQERRTALISSAVTGKIDVRNWQAPTLAEAKTELSA